MIFAKYLKEGEIYPKLPLEEAVCMLNLSFLNRIPVTC